MKNYNRILSQIFGQALMVHEDTLELAVQWVNQRMNLNIINLQSIGEELPSVDAARGGGSRLQIAQQTGVYVVPIHGVLVARSAHMDMCTPMTSYEQIRSMLNEAITSSGVEHVVLDIDSPGGAATGVMELADEIYQARVIKPITAISNFSAFSAAYALASAASQVVISQSSGVGSIGVIARHIDRSKQNEDQGIKVTSVYAGARKNDLSSENPISDEALAFLTDLVQLNYQQFISTVAKNRGLTVDAVKNTEAGVYFGQKAVDIGLADRIETPQLAINRIAREVESIKQANRPNRISARAAAIQNQSHI